jgi:hypothetical protein
MVQYYCTVPNKELNDCGESSITTDMMNKEEVRSPKVAAFLSAIFKEQPIL